MTSPLILISLGILFAPKMAHFKLVSLTIFIRMALGLGMGIVMATLMKLEGTTFSVVCLCAAGPIGFMSLTYASLARLNWDFSSSALSMSIFVGVLYIPMLMCLFVK